MTVFVDDGVQQTRVDQPTAKLFASSGVIDRLARRPRVEQPHTRSRQTKHAKWGAPEQCGTVGAATSVGIKYPSLPLFRHEPNVRGNLMDPKTDPQNTDATASQVTDEALVEEELLVEEISIDGMCGVY